MGNALDGTGAIPALNILDFIGDAVAALNEEWCFTYVNASTVEMARLPEQSLLGGNLWNLFPELVGTVAERHLRCTMQERVRTSFEHHYEPFGLWVEVNAHATPGGLTMFVRDVTARKQAEE